MITVKRVYEHPEPDDGARFLVERLWPRGVKRESLKMADWLKEVAPSNNLRVWFGHDPSKWDEFRERYYEELEKIPEALKPILDSAPKGNVCLLYSARDTEHNNALALKQYLEERLNL
jgi:uncharacterized protein YeaO (DUF488 family)